MTTQQQWVGGSRPGVISLLTTIEEMETVGNTRARRFPSSIINERGRSPWVDTSDQQKWVRGQSRKSGS